MYRAFLAIDVEEAEVADRVAELQRIIAGTGADVKLVERENLHLTLQFLGEIPEPMVEGVYKVMSCVKMSPFKAQLRGLGAFPSMNFPRVVWVGVEKGASEVEGIYRQLEPGLKKLGFRSDKEFAPHLTIARVKSGRNRDELAKTITKLSDVEVGEMVVKSIRLKKSVLTPSGPIYSTLRECRFG